MRLWLTLLALDACVPAEKHLMMQGDPLACINQPLPQTAPSRLTVSGTVLHPTDFSPFPDVPVATFLGSSQTSTSTSDNNGGYEGSAANPSMTPAANLYLLAHLNDPTYHDTFWFPAVPVSGDVQDNFLTLFSNNDLAAFQLALGGTLTFDPTKGHILLQVHDCNGMPLLGVTVSTNPPGDVIYFSQMTPTRSAVMTDGVAFVLIANVNPVETTLTAKINGMDLRPHTFMVTANAIVQTLIQP
jgi:hypothetical protein